ncbi:alpha/beta fold hydrolase [Aerosticca soli]|uniref:Beta-ketoadipate enol-lactone hydrolase n=1 Tax=Aerosticca soli TaxID=2010829 RepID=A0A2Z6E300_9GAMM|nr:alpha/beta fold hydrolase [Aerosticca soli]BBD78969.1 beta-ketoadipate enol-lactone hydrolase [Aerosticca soli]
MTDIDRPLWQRLLLRRLKFLLVVIAVLALLFGGGYLFAPQWLLRADNARQAMAAHLESHSVQAGDTRWVYYEGGQGPTLVLLHGFGADRSVWLPLARELGGHFHLVIPDLPGWGESSRIEGANYDLDAQAARLQDFVQALRLGRFVLVGHSMGGGIAGVYAAEHPEHVAGLALIDAFGLKMRENDFARESLAGRNPFVYDDRAGFERVLALTFARPPSMPGRIEDVFIARNRAARAFIERTFDALRRPEQYLAVQQRLDRLTMPVLGLWCRDDKVMDVSALDSLRAGLSHAASIDSAVLYGCNHMPILEKPADVARILTGFALSH